MEFGLKIILITAKVLIKIGDFILWLFNYFLKIAKRAWSILFFLLKKIELYLIDVSSNFKRAYHIKLLEIKKVKSAFIFERKLKKERVKKIKSSPKPSFSFNKAFSPLCSFLRSTFFAIFRALRKIFSFSYLKRKKKRTVKKRSKFFIPLLKARYFFLGIIFSLIFVFLPIVFIMFLQNLPNPKELSNTDVEKTTKIFDRNGNLLYQIYANQNRTPVPLSSIPQELKEATIAIEDKDFYKNPGFDLQAIIRAAIADLKGEPLQGGSTITQQLIKSRLLSPEITIERKVKEIILAFWSERIYSKDQILEMYFNQIPYGGTAWGAEAASEVYFHKEVSELTLAESAFLAGMPRAPSIYSPYGDTPNLWKKRQKEVLSRMKELGYITEEERATAEAEELFFQPPQIPIHAPHFVMYVKEYLIEKYGLPLVEKGGLNVVTSLDLTTQEMAENVVGKEVDNGAVYNFTNGAALITSPSSGDILAMVGSKDYNDPSGGNVNITTSLRQPGSTVKAITYSVALANGFTAASSLNDSPTSFPSASGFSYRPVNYDGKFRGNVSLRFALANSINIPAVKVLQKVGIDKMVSLAKKMGITTWKDPSNYGLSITLGAAEVKMVDLATVYGTLANQGKKVDLNPILKITDYKGNTVFEKDETKFVQVMDEGVAYIISDILADNRARATEFGLNSPLNVNGKYVSVKTGTSDSFRDNWTIGYTPDVLVAVWVGNNDNQPMNRIASGITGAAPIWHQLMERMIEDKNNQKTLPPRNIVSKFCGRGIEYFITGTEGSVHCPTATPSSSLISNQ